VHGLVVLLAYVPAAGALLCGLASATGMGPSPNLEDMSCPSPSLCVAVDSHDRAVISTDPTAARPTWYAANIKGVVDLTAISCASTAFCIAVDSNGLAAGEVQATSRDSERDDQRVRITNNFQDEANQDPRGDVQGESKVPTQEARAWRG
jgi:hypothetical protein